MRKVKITVLKRTFNSELAKEYGVDNLSACSIFNDGQVFYTYCKKPETLCDGAWNAMSKYVFSIAHGADSEPFYLGDWVKLPGVAICSCNDGLRPVIFKIESAEPQTNIFSDSEEFEQNENLEEIGVVADDAEIEDSCLEEDDAENEDGCLEDEDTNDAERIIVEIPRQEVPAQGPSSEEFIVSVYKDTKSIDLLDEFEGISGNGERYRRMVVNPGHYLYAYGQEFYYHYVIERSHDSNYAGDITFTDFKKGYTYELNRHIQLELTDEIVTKYKDTDKFYRLKKPYHLRAQNSSNRTGYGWEWYWSNGVGEYTEGTLYGETTDYIFSGVYISSKYRYDIDSRVKFSDDSIMSNKNDKEIRVKGYIEGNYPLIVYDGKLSEITSLKTEAVFIPVMKLDEQKLLPISFCSKNQKIYVFANTFNAYKNEFMSDKIFETINKD
mgnify:CR=1 FL=1